MGGGSYSTASFASVVNDLDTSGKTFARSATSARSGDYSARAIADILDPRKLKDGRRESCYVPGSTSLLPVVIAMDATGSMGSVPREVRDQLPKLMETLIEQGISDHPNILFMAFDDETTTPQAAFQMGQFEIEPKVLLASLNEFVFPGKGGANNGESYHLPIYATANHTRLESFEREGEKGVFVLIGDEPPLLNAADDWHKNGTSPELLKNLFNVSAQKDIPMVDSLRKLLETYHVLIIRPGQTSNGRDKEITTMWQKLMTDAGGNPQHVIEVEKTASITAAITLFIGKSVAGLDHGDLVDVLSAKGAVGVADAARATSAIVSYGAGKLVGAGKASGELVPADEESGGRARV
jgi:hypothetical protein